MKKIAAWAIILFSMANLFANQTSERVTLILSYTSKEYEKSYFAKVADSLVAGDNWFWGDVKMVYPIAAALSDSIQAVNQRYQELVLVINVHGVGYSNELLAPFGGVVVHNDPTGEVDAKENNLRQAGILITGQNSIRPAGVGKKMVEERLYDYSVLIGDNYIDITSIMEIHGIEFAAGRELSPGKFVLIKKFFYITADLNRDGLITFNNFVQTAEQNLYYVTNFANNPIVYLEQFKEEETGRCDFDYDGRQDDFLFVVNNHLAIDVDYYPSEIEVDGIDEDDDGVFTAVDYNSDGDKKDLMWYKEELVLADGVLREDKFRQIISGFDGTKILLIGSCYGAGLIDRELPANTIGYALVSDTSMAFGGVLVNLKKEMAKANKNSSFLSVFNNFCFPVPNVGFNCGYLNDNGDNIFSLLPLEIFNIKDGQEGFLALKTKILPQAHTPLAIVASSDKLPEKFSLAQNYPNPFNAVTTIAFSIPQPTQVKLKVYNLAGQEVATLVDEFRPAGNYEVKWQANNFATEVYFYRLESKNFVQQRKMLLIK